MLGLHFDESLRMNVAVSELAREAGWRLQSVLRPRRFFSERQVVNLYEAQVLSFVGSSTAGYYHAAPSVLNALDRVQRRLCRELGLCDEIALDKYNLAPLLKLFLPMISIAGGDSRLVRRSQPLLANVKVASRLCTIGVLQILCDSMVRKKASTSSIAHAAMAMDSDCWACTLTNLYA